MATKVYSRELGKWIDAAPSGGAVSLSQLDTIATNSFLGRSTAGTGTVEVLSAASAKSILGISTVVNSVNGVSGNVKLKEFVEVTKSWTGTTPFFVTERTLPAGTYTEFSAHIGTNSLTDTAYCIAKKPDGTVLKTLSKTGIPGEVATTGFTLAADTVVSFSIYGSSSTTVSYIFSIGIK